MREITHFHSHSVFHKGKVMSVLYSHVTVFSTMLLSAILCRKRKVCEAGYDIEFMRQQVHIVVKNPS